MIIKSLKLKNYRNYDLLDLTFDPKTNILYGDNAQGKTNHTGSIVFVWNDEISQRNEGSGYDTVWA